MIKTRSDFKIDTVLLVFAENGNYTIDAPKIRGPGGSKRANLKMKVYKVGHVGYQMKGFFRLNMNYFFTK